MVLDTFLLNTQHYKVRVKDKVEQSKNRSSAPLHLGVVAIEKGAFWSPSPKVANFTFNLSLKVKFIERTGFELANSDAKFTFNLSLKVNVIERTGFELANSKTLAMNQRNNSFSCQHKFVSN